LARDLDGLCVVVVQVVRTEPKTIAIPVPVGQYIVTQVARIDLNATQVDTIIGATVRTEPFVVVLWWVFLIGGRIGPPVTRQVHATAAALRLGICERADWIVAVAAVQLLRC
jgi:hypothetical protein